MMVEVFVYFLTRFIRDFQHEATSKRDSGVTPGSRKDKFRGMLEADGRPLIATRHSCTYQVTEERTRKLMKKKLMKYFKAKDV